MNTSIWATFKDSFDIGCRVIKWDELDGFNFIPKGRYHKRDIDMAALSALMKQFTVHWSVTYRAKDVYNVLNTRQISCNFIIDDDDVNGYATIYQCLPIMYGGFSQGSVFNALGPGVEIAYMPEAWERNMYTPEAQKKWDVPNHDTKKAKIHGTSLNVHLPTEAQMQALYQLMWGFVELFPKIPPTFPKDDKGDFRTTNLFDPAKYTGFANHYHLKREKIDTAGLDMQKIEEEVQKRLKSGF